MTAKNVLILTGSPRKNGNSTIMAGEFHRGAQDSGASVEIINAHEIDINFCSGCLRCNLLKRCALKDNAWNDLAKKILAADILVLATPVYFHHVSAPLKKILDRFRSFLHVQLTETGLTYTPWQKWQKEWVLLLALGSSSTTDANPIVDLFKFMTTTLGPENRLHTTIGSRLAASGQLSMNQPHLSDLYGKLQLPPHFADDDFRKNRRILQSCYYLARELTKN